MIPIRRLSLAALALLACASGLAFLARAQNPTSSPQGNGAPAAANIYEDDRIRVSIPEGWSLSKPTETFMTVSGASQTQSIPGAVLTNGKYKLYLLTHNGQASGAPGGRLGEITEFMSPWLNATEICADYINPVPTKITGKLSRVDNYFDLAHPTMPVPSDEGPKNCGETSKPGVFWYGSYFQQTCPSVAKSFEESDCGGYFLYYPDLVGKHVDQPTAADEMVFTIAYDTADPNTTPHQGDPDLQKMLDEASAIVSSIIYK